VSIAGTARGALTRTDGRYLITGVPAGQHRVRATLVGYGTAEETVTLAAGQTATVDFQLTDRAVELEEVVAVGYGVQHRQEVTGAVASVRAEEIRQIPTANAIDAIKGRVAGVDVVAEGYAPGAGVRVRVRGERSIRAGNEPLYVVDGIPLSGGIGDFNPQDIQSIEILKDASATAIYGARGANGVVLITTNRGRPGRTQLTYETYAGVQNILNPVTLMDGPQFAAMKRESYRTAGLYPCPGMTICPEGDRAIFYAEELEALETGRSTDWQDLILRRGLQHSHQLSIRGGDERTRFSVSGSLFDQEGITRGMDYDRQSGAINVEHVMGRLRAGVSTHVSRSTQNLGRGNGLWSSAHQNNPLGAAHDADGNIVFLPTPDALMSNPLADVENWQREIVNTRLFGSVFTEFELMNGVNWRVNFGPDLLFRRDGEFRGAMTNANRGSPADASLAREQIFAYTLDNLITARRNFGDHALDFTGLYSIQQEHGEFQQTSVNQLPYEHQRFHNLGSAGEITGVGSQLREWTLQSYMGRLNYGFQQKYLLTMTGRIDGSSRLAPGNKYAFFPSIAAAWRLSEEPFLAAIGLFSELKLRASWGRTGNTAIDPYQTQGSLRRTNYILGDAPAYGYVPNELENPDLEWEKTEQFDVGVDFGMLANRITGSLDFYHSNTHDLLLERQLPGATGFSRILENIGQTQNRGVELALSSINLEGWRGIRWTTDVNFTVNRNQIVSLYGGNEDDVGNRWFIGHPIQVWYDYRFDGIWQLDQAEEAARFGQKPGQIRVVDQNDDGRIDAADRVILGTSYPDWTGSLANRLEWGNFDLSAFLTARQGFVVNDQFGTSRNELGGRYNNLAVGYWMPENPSNLHPRPDRSGTLLYGSSRAFVDASFVRLRNVTLGYTVPAGLASRIGGESLRLYASAQDPFVFTGYQGFDPESGTGSSVPSYRTLLIGARVGF
jgi:TonB-linked SusC/RagA family outer membrane protein